MTLLIPDQAMAARVEVGGEHRAHGLVFKEEDLGWRDYPGWPGRQYAIARTGSAAPKWSATTKRMPQGLMFERDKPHAA